jgi:ketosteroid isomerase-like protein
VARDHREAIREIFRRWNEGDREFPPELFDESIRIDSTLTRAMFEGVAGAERWTREIDEQFDRWEIAYDEILDAGSDRILVLGSIRLRGRESGVEFDQPAAYLCVFREGRISALSTFSSHQEGREAAGLA